jgi:integrase
MEGGVVSSNLTAVAVDKLRPGAARREVPVGGARGLVVVVQPSGAKSWAMRFRRPGGRLAKLTLGPVAPLGHEQDGDPVIGAPLSLAAARRLANQVHHERAQGHDVVAEHQSAQRRQRDARASTFGAAAVQFVDEHARPRTRRWRETAGLLGLEADADGVLSVRRGGLADRWRDKPVAEVTPDDIHEVVQEARRRAVPGLPARRTGMSDGQGRAMRAALSKLFAWLLQHRTVRSNPCAGVAAPAASPARDRVLSDAELRLLWQAAGSLGEPFGPLVRLLLLTGARLNEVAQMTAAELSEDGARWTLPAARSKNRRPHEVPLPQAARDILAGVHRIAGRPGYVFSTTGDAPVSGFSKVKARLDAAMLALAREADPEATIPPWRLHDLRRTAATGMAGLGTPPHIVEAVLNHVSGARAGVAGVYNRAAYLPEREEALAAWAAHVLALASQRPAGAPPALPSNVLRLRPAAAAPRPL